VRNSILHLADLHLGAPVSRRLRELYPKVAAELEDSRNRVLDRLVDWIGTPESHVGLVVIAGDLFHDHKPEDRFATQIRESLARIASVVPVITVPGNHDEYSYSDCVYRAGPWPGRLVTESEPTRVWGGELENRVNVGITSIAYEAGKLPAGGSVTFPPSEPNTIGVVLVHGTLAEKFQGVILEGERCFVVSQQQVADAGYHFLALGHIHAPNTWQRGQCVAVYPGPPVGTAPSRPGSGAFVLAKTSREGVTVSHVRDPALIGRRWSRLRLEVKPEEDVAEAAARLDAMLTEEEDLISIVELSGTVVDERFSDTLQQMILESGKIAVVESEGLDVAPPVDLATLLHEQSLAGELARCWQEWCDDDPPEEVNPNLVLHEALAALSRKKR